VLPNWNVVGGGVEDAPFCCAKGFEILLLAVKLKSPPKPEPDWAGGWKAGMLCCCGAPKMVDVGVPARLLRWLPLGFRACAILDEMRD
jgi:hypothetical protein